MTDILAKVKKSGIREFGCRNNLVAEYWEKSLEQLQNLNLVIALDNNDQSKVLLELVKDNLHLFLKGLQTAVEILNPKDTSVIITESEHELFAELVDMTAGMQIAIKQGNFVDPIYYQGAVRHHLATMVVIGQVMEGLYQGETYLAIQKDGAKGLLKRIPFGTPFDEVINLDKEKIKAVRIGTRIYPNTLSDDKVTEDFVYGDHLIRVFTNDVCIVAKVRDQLNGYMQLGCGKCTFCREGLLLLHAYVKDITDNKGKAENLNLITEIAETMEGSSLCSVGLKGGELVLDSLEFFKDEYIEHIKEKKCAADVCTSFSSIYIEPRLCTGCMECIDVCPVNCIEGKNNYIHMIDEFDCTKCGKCIDICDEGAIIKTEGKVPKLPRRLTKVGKFKK